VIACVSGSALAVIKQGDNTVNTYCKGSVLSDLKMRADNGNADALYEYGLLLFFAHCLPEDPATGLSLLKMAASKGHIEAAFSLGDIYADKSLPDLYNADKAHEYLLLAAEKNHVLAQHILGIILSRGDLGVDHQHQGLYWLGVAASKSHKLSAVIMGHYYQYGKYGIKQDPCLARDWYELCLILGVQGAINLINTIDAEHTCN